MSEAEALCPNCGAPRSGRYCGKCGQSDRSYLRATTAIVGEVLGEVVGLDTRLARTLRLLIRPGFLTEEFNRGRRASYVSPVRLYLAVSLVFFAVLSFEGRTSAQTQLWAGPETRLQLEAGNTSELDAMYAGLTRDERARLRALLEQRGLATDALRQRLAQLDAERPPPTSATGLEGTVRARVLDVLEDPAGAWSKLVSDLPAAMFVTLPLYAGWLKLMYRRRFYSEHLVFALHLHAFFFVLGTLALLLPGALAPVLPALQLAGGGYYLLALRRVYAQSWPRTAAKFVAINAVHFAAIGLGIGAAALAALFVN